MGFRRNFCAGKKSFVKISQNSRRHSRIHQNLIFCEFFQCQGELRDFFFISSSSTTTEQTIFFFSDRRKAILWVQRWRQNWLNLFGSLLKVGKSEQTWFYNPTTYLSHWLVWPDLPKFRHFDKIFKVLGIFWKFIYYMAKFWTYCGKFRMPLGTFSLMQMAKCWKII